MPRRFFAFLTAASLLVGAGVAEAAEPVLEAATPVANAPAAIVAPSEPSVEKPALPLTKFSDPALRRDEATNARDDASDRPTPFANVRFPVHAPDAPAQDATSPTKPTVVVDTRPKMQAFVVRRWYGWQPLVSDAASFTAGSAFRSPAILFTGYALGAPTIHLLHGEPLRAAKSFGMRVAIPAAAALAGCAASGALFGDKLAHPCVEGAGVGLLAGMVTAIAIDASAFSYDPARAKDVAKEKRTTTALLPGVSFVSGGARVEVRGIF